MRNTDPVVIELRERVTTIVREETGLKAVLAMTIADSIVEGMRAEWGGSNVWIPAKSKEQRNISIIDAWHRGLNSAQNASMHGVHRTTIYRVINERNSIE